MQARVIKHFPSASFTGPPVWCAAGREKICCFLSRPAGGGPICMLSFVAGDGRDVIPPVDLRPTGIEDAFAAAPFISDAAPENGGGTLKAYVNVKMPGGGNDRELLLVETGIVPVVAR